MPSAIRDKRLFSFLGFGESSVSSSILPLLLGLLAFILLLTMAGCKHRHHHSEEHRPEKVRPAIVTIYFSKYQGSQSIVESVRRPLPPDKKTDPLAFALSELFKGPTSEEKSQGFFSEIPEGTRLLGLEKKQKTITVDLSRQFSTGGGSNSMSQRFEELKRTLHSINTKDTIRLTVEGKPLELLGGEGLEVPDALKHELQ